MAATTKQRDARRARRRRHNMTMRAHDRRRVRAKWNELAGRRRIDSRYRRLAFEQLLQMVQDDRALVARLKEQARR